MDEEQQSAFELEVPAWVTLPSVMWDGSLNVTGFFFYLCVSLNQKLSSVKQKLHNLLLGKYFKRVKIKRLYVCGQILAEVS